VGVVTALNITGDPQADALLDADPFALLTGMMLDQQIPMEKAFGGPRVLATRLGLDRLDPARIASMDPGAFAAAMAGPPAVHRYHSSMAARVQALAGHVEQQYAGDAAAIWTGVGSGQELLARVRRPEGPDLPGPARQAARGHPRRVAAGGRRLRHPRTAFGRRRRRRRLAVRGPRVQACCQGGRPGGGGSAARFRLVGPWRFPEHARMSS
jgi:uncharacterized HhH-GPD family protein